MSVLLDVPQTMPGEKLPPAMPTVQVDAMLVDSPEQVKFDYAAFYDMARTAKLTDEHIEDYTVHFIDGERPFGGLYTPRRRLSEISIKSCLEMQQAAQDTDPHTFQKQVIKRYGIEAYVKTDISSIINATFMHETGHYIDDMSGNMRRNRRRHNVPRFLPFYAAGAGPLANMLGANPGVVSAGMLGVAGVCSFVALREKFRSPARKRLEKPAYDFMIEQQDTTIVHFIPTMPYNS